MTNLSLAIQNILKENESLKLSKDRNKIVCNLTGHEMPCKLDALTCYINGKKYKRLKAKSVPDFSMDKYKDFIVPSVKKHNEGQLFCKLTTRHICKEPHHLKKHIEGRRFQKAFRRWQECQETGVEFKPFTMSKRRLEAKTEYKDGFGSHRESEEDNFSDASSLSDLYPADDFKDEDDGEIAESFTEIRPKKRKPEKKSKVSHKNGIKAKSGPGKAIKKKRKL